MVSELDSMYAAYNEEYENAYTVFLKDVGFINYKIESETPFEVYIKELYVVPGKRGAKQAGKLADLCIKEVESRYNKPIEKLYGSVGIGSNDSTPSFKAMIDYGFKLLSANEEMIYLYKEL